jgi:hypothetical protein
MTEQQDAAPRPPDSPALRRAEQALQDVAGKQEAPPADQVEPLAAAQAALADLLAEEPADPSTTREA